MGIKKYNPVTPGLRGMTVSTFEEITASKPEKSLTVTLKKHSGRNSRGKITVRHRGGVLVASIGSLISRETKMEFLEMLRQ